MPGLASCTRLSSPSNMCLTLLQPWETGAVEMLAQFEVLTLEIVRSSPHLVRNVNRVDLASLELFICRGTFVFKGKRASGLCSLCPAATSLVLESTKTGGRMRLEFCLPRSPNSQGAESLLCHLLFQGTCHLSDLDNGVVIDVERGNWGQWSCLSTSQPRPSLGTGLLLLAGIRTLALGLDTCFRAPDAVASSLFFSSFGPSIAF